MCDTISLGVLIRPSAFESARGGLVHEGKTKRGVLETWKVLQDEWKVFYDSKME
jgi:hypothetical protein